MVKSRLIIDDNKVKLEIASPARLRVGVRETNILSTAGHASRDQWLGSENLCATAVLTELARGRPGD
jgi:hypothetical protein